MVRAEQEDPFRRSVDVISLAARIIGGKLGRFGLTWKVTRRVPSLSCAIPKEMSTRGQWVPADGEQQLAGLLTVKLN